ncbi:hypothetical protein FLA_2124 [Filimonas lacunae]|nr:hypothetical protein FLA_2124 [Filimonas lacunae]
MSGTDKSLNQAEQPLNGAEQACLTDPDIPAGGMLVWLAGIDLSVNGLLVSLAKVTIPVYK